MPRGATENPEIPRGVGNIVSREFNLVYRWHSVQSEADAVWLNDFMKEMFPGKDVPNLSSDEFFSGLREWMEAIPEEPLERKIHGFPRNADGSYDDEVLMQILREAIDNPAGMLLPYLAGDAGCGLGADKHEGSFGTNHVPLVLKPLEKEAILQARKWNVVTLNEFRSFFNLTTLDTFEAINPDKAVAESLAKLYATPDDVELYPGLYAEEIRPNLEPGQGLCRIPFPSEGSAVTDSHGLP